MNQKREKEMNKLLGILLVLLFCINPLVGCCQSHMVKLETGKTNHAMVLELCTNKNIYQPLEPIILLIKAQNISDTTVSINFPKRFSEDGYSINVYNKTYEKESQLTEYGNKFYTAKSSPISKREVMNEEREKAVHIKPQSSYTKQIILNRIYDLSLCSNYVISSSMTVYDWISSLTAIQMKSKPIQIRIVNNESLMPETNSPGSRFQPIKSNDF